jgi:hypothetical protein
MSLTKQAMNRKLPFLNNINGIVIEKIWEWE